MTLVDLVHHFVEDVAPSALLLCIVAGAALLWRRTRRASSLAQLVASVLLFVGFGLDQLRWRSVTPYDHSAYADVMRSAPIHIAMSAWPIGFVVFAIGYLWYALTQKRI
jgi:cbb3-type cytochrome oxidase subunit 3